LIVYYFLERIFIGDVVNQYCTIGHSVVNRPQSMKPLLSGRIPYRQVYSPSIEIELFLDKWRLYQPVDMITHQKPEQLYRNNISTSAQRTMYQALPVACWHVCHWTCLRCTVAPVTFFPRTLRPTALLWSSVRSSCCQSRIDRLPNRPSWRCCLSWSWWNVTFVRTTHTRAHTHTQLVVKCHRKKAAAVSDYDIMHCYVTKKKRKNK